VLGSASLYLKSAIPQLNFEFLNPLQQVGYFRKSATTSPQPEFQVENSATAIPQVQILEVRNRNSASAKFVSPQLQIRKFWLFSACQKHAFQFCNKIINFIPYHQVLITFIENNFFDFQQYFNRNI